MRVGGLLFLLRFSLSAGPSLFDLMAGRASQVLCLCLSHMLDRVSCLFPVLAGLAHIGVARGSVVEVMHVMRVLGLKVGDVGESVGMLTFLGAGAVPTHMASLPSPIHLPI